MAKGNLFLGMGRGKVGDVVFYRMNGWQMARVRNRDPKNPRSNEQLYQRAVIATTMKAYSLAKEIYDHSFQSYTVGEGCMRRFNSLNARIIRSYLASDINNALIDDECKGRLVPPRAVSPVPVPGLQVSEGTLEQNLFESISYQGGYAFQLVNMEEVNSIETYFGRLNINAGDIFTILYVLSDDRNEVFRTPYSDSAYGIQYDTKYAWVRLTVRDRDMSSLQIGTAKYSDAFEIEYGGNAVINVVDNRTFSLGVPLALAGANNFLRGTVACIRSREDVKLRSTSFALPYGNQTYGLTSNFILDVWRNEVQKIGSSDLILEGGEGLQTLNENPDEKPIVDGPEVEAPLPKRGRTKA